MDFVKSISLVLGLISILLSSYSFLGFFRLTRFWFQLPTIERYQELFAYLSVFVASFISALLLITIMAVA